MSRLTQRLITAAVLAFSAAPLIAQSAGTDQTYTITLRELTVASDPAAIGAEIAALQRGTFLDAAEGEITLRLSPARAAVVAADPRVKTIVPHSNAASARRLKPASEAVNWGTGVAYTYDASGNVRKIGTDIFIYDAVGRLVQGDANGVRRNYEYDAYGNRTKCTQAAGTASEADCQFGYTIQTATNRVAGVVYDAAGNVHKLGTHTYTFDALNMMTGDTTAAGTRKFIYTADDERIAVYDGASWQWTVREVSGKVLREFTSTDGPSGLGTANWKWTKDYIWRNGLLLASRQTEPGASTPTTYHYHLDHLGTPRRITNASDQIVGIHDYHAFGPEVGGGTNEPSLSLMKFTGHERDIIGSENWDTLDYMHARYYSGGWGRFLSVDPVLGEPAVPQAWNRYAYVINNPLKYQDRAGRYYELANEADRQFFITAIASGTTNKAARELIQRQAGDPVHRIVLATASLRGAFTFGDASILHRPFSVIAGNLFAKGITITVDKGKLAMVSYPTATISTYHELKHADIIMYQGLAENGKYPDQIFLNPATGVVTTNSIFEEFARAAATTADDPMHALSAATVNEMLARPGEGKPTTGRCVSIICIGENR